MYYNTSFKNYITSINANYQILYIQALKTLLLSALSVKAIYWEII